MAAMIDPLRAARARQLARLPDSEKPPAPRAALAIAKSKAYQAAADAPGTLRAYAADLAHFRAWCEAHGFQPMPASPETVGAYLAAAGLGYALPTLRRRVAAIARAHRVAKQPLDTRPPAIRETLRGIARAHGEPARRSAALTTDEIKRLVEVCGDDMAALRDRALLLIGFAGALRRSELVGLDVAHIKPAPSGLRMMIPRSKTDAAGEGAEIGIMRGVQEDTCPVRALRAWLRAAKIGDGPVFRRVTQWGTVGTNRLHPDAVRQILLRRAVAAGDQGHPPGAGDAARHARRLRHHSLSERCAGRRDHEPHKAPKPDYHAELCPPGQLGAASPSGKLDL